MPSNDNSKFESVTDPRDPRYGDTRSETAKKLDTGEQQADNLGPVPPGDYVSQAIASQYATPGRVGLGEKPKFNTKIVTSWDEQHPEDPGSINDSQGEVVDEDDDTPDQVPEVDAVRPIDQPKQITPVLATDEDGRPRQSRSKAGGPVLTPDEVVEVEKARDEATEGATDEAAVEAYAAGERL